MLPNFEIFRERFKRAGLNCSSHLFVFSGHSPCGGFHKATVPGFNLPVSDGRVGNHLELGGIAPYLFREKDPRAGVPGGGIEHGATVERHRAALSLNQHVILHFIFKIFAGRTVGRAKMSVITHVIEDFLRVNLKLR